MAPRRDSTFPRCQHRGCGGATGQPRWHTLPLTRFAAREASPSHANGPRGSRSGYTGRTQLARRLLYAGATLLVISAAYAVQLYSSLPDVSTLAVGRPRLVTDWVSIDSVSQGTACAIVAAEDLRFFQHRGIDWVSVRTALAEAPTRALTGQRIRGASTITQQLARTLFLSPRRTPDRKLREWLIARRLENAMPKARLLELYTNLARWTSTGRGLSTGSKTYFGKEAVKLTPFEAVLLASVLPAPHAPFEGPRQFATILRQRRILGQLRAAAIVDETATYAAVVAIAALESELRNEATAGEAIPVAAQMERLSNGREAGPRFMSRLSDPCRLGVPRQDPGKSRAASEP